MSPSLRLVAVATATLAAACFGAASAGATAAGCGKTSYSYAGLLSSTAGFGVSARVTAVRRPRVTKGHVAAWVGVGGPGMGPSGTDVWLQVGISATESQGPALYYEVALPNRTPRYVVLREHVPLATAFDIAVFEVRGRPGWWQVSVNGAPKSKRIFLPGSHGRWGPVATAESWNGDLPGTCNAYSFRFQQVEIATIPGGAWQPMSQSRRLADAGYQLRREPNGLLAVGG